MNCALASAFHCPAKDVQDDILTSAFPIKLDKVNIRPHLGSPVIFSSGSNLYSCLRYTAMAIPDSFLAKTIDFNGTQIERLEPITDFRRDPCEARILCTCRMISPQDAEEFILKVKVQ